MNNISNNIRWATRSLNPVVGCTFGCEYCYARTINNRFKGVHPECFAADFTKPQYFPERLKQLAEKKPQIIFMDSMSDVADWPLEASRRIRDAQLKNPQHVYLHLTKRPGHIENASTDENFWYGVSVTSSYDESRFRDLVFCCDGSYCFASIEPILGKLSLDGDYWYLMDWFIIGAESGNRKGKVIPEKAWVDHIVGEARRMGIPVFMKDSLVPIMGEENMIREFPEAITEWIQKGAKK